MTRTTVVPLILWGWLAVVADAQNASDIIMSLDNGDLELFKRNMNAGEDVNTVLNNGYTILNYAIVKKRTAFVDYLLNHSADIEMASGIYTPLMFSVFSDPGIMLRLISEGADINRIHFGKSAVQLAIKTGQQRAVEILREHGATVVLSGGPDGPYIFFDDSTGTSVSISVTSSNHLSIDTLQGYIHEVDVQTPLDKSFRVSLRKPDSEIASIYDDPGKIFALSDIEGNYADFVTILTNNDIIDHNLNWIFGDGHLVLLGDFVDRGAYVTQVLWLIYKLEQEATEQGGMVHYIVGNHEVMNITGDVRYAHEKYHLLAYQLNMGIQDFFSPNSVIGAWIRSRNAIEKIGDFIFVHGGISDSLVHAGLSLPEINDLVRQSYDRPVAEWDNSIPLVMGEYGILWYRGLIQDHAAYEKLPVASLDSIVDFYDARRMVIGHCVVEDITTDYNGRVIRIDVDHYENPSSGILIVGDRIYKTTKSGQKKILLNLP